MTHSVFDRLLRATKARARFLPLASWSGVEPGFIVSTGRTGTLRLAEVLAEATESVLVLHEPPPDLFDLGEAVACGDLGFDSAARSLRRLRQPQANRLRRQGSDAYVESNNNAGYLPQVIRAVFSEPRFIHVVRDGRSTVRSLYSNVVPSRRSARHNALFMDHDDHRCRLSALDFPDDPLSGEWQELSRFERVCWYWAKKNALIREALGDADDFLVIRFEDLFDREAGFPGFWRMVEFLGLRSRLTRSEGDVRALLTKRSNRADRYLLPPHDEWSTDLRDRFLRIAGEEHHRFYPYGNP